MYDVITEVPVGKIFSSEKKLQINFKWSETRTNQETADPSAAADQFPGKSTVLSLTSDTLSTSSAFFAQSYNLFWIFFVLKDVWRFNNATDI